MVQFIGVSDLEMPKMVEPYFQVRILWQIVNQEAQIPVEFPINNTSISLSFRDCDRRTDKRLPLL